MSIKITVLYKCTEQIEKRLIIYLLYGEESEEMGQLTGSIRTIAIYTKGMHLRSYAALRLPLRE